MRKTETALREMIALRLSREQLSRIRLAAALRGSSVSELIRRAAMRETEAITSTTAGPGDIR